MTKPNNLLGLSNQVRKENCTPTKLKTSAEKPITKNKKPTNVQSPRFMLLKF
ncbi:MAG: hypothetical protein ACI9JY_001779 [Saprospiraceae bacterium]|jgi:hypothetical protein